MKKLIECVPNFSEGRNRQVIDQIVAAIAATEGVYGDVTGDGNVNGQDIQALINAIVSESTDPKYDVNEDGKINGQDIQVLINIIVASN